MRQVKYKGQTNVNGKQRPNNKQIAKSKKTIYVEPG